MLFTSPTFLFIFLPLVLGIYSIFPPKQRKYVILVSNISFYTLTNLKDLTSVLFLCFIMILTLLSVCIIQRKKNEAFAQAFAVMFCVVLLLIFYTTRILTQNGYGILNVVYPLGASIYILNAISLLIDIKRKDVSEPTNYVNFVIYLSFFPVMIAGPLIKYKNFERYISSPEFNLKNFAFGSKLFAIGFIKRIAIAAVLYEAYERIVASMAGNIDLIHSALFLIVFSLIVYFSFSGYSDMGCGMSNMFGIIQKRDYVHSSINGKRVRYMGYLFNSMLKWVDDYIANPFMKLGRGKTNAKKFFIEFIICCFITLWFKTNIFVLISVTPILLILTAYNFYLNKNHNKKKKTIFRIISGAGVLILMSLYWISIKLENPAVFFQYLISSFVNFSTYTTYYTLYLYLNLKYIIVFVIAILIFIFSSTFNISKLSKINIRLPKYINYVSTTLVLITFFITLYYFLPQYPEYATKAYQIFDI